MKIFTRTAIVLSLVIGLASCSKDDGAAVKTNATITLKNAAGQPVEGVTVYVYDQETWDMTGDETFFAEGQATSGQNGKARFTNLEYTLTFNDINNNQNNMRFSAHYSLSGVSKTKVKAIMVSKGDSKSDELILD